MSPFAQGVLEILPDGYGFLRILTYVPVKTTFCVSPSNQKFDLRKGTGWSVAPKKVKVCPAMVESVNGVDPDQLSDRLHFMPLTPIFPEERLSPEQDGAFNAIVDLRAPLAGRG